MNRHSGLICIAVLMSFATSGVRAADRFWQGGGTGNLGDAKYTDSAGTLSPVLPTTGDILFIGGSANVTAGVSQDMLKLRIGHVTGLAANQGVGTVTVNNGAKINLTATGTGANSSLVIGAGAVATTNSGVTGVLNIDGAGSTVTSADYVQIGFGSRGAATATATINITNGGSLVVTTDGINMGDRNGSSGAGLPGRLNISDPGSSLTIAAAGGDLLIGIRAGSTYTQTDGTVSIGDSIVVGDNGANASSFTMSGGTLTSQSLTIGETANNVVGSITGDSVVTLKQNNLNVGLDDSQNASLTVGGNANIDIQSVASGNGNVFVGRGTSTGAKFTMTGGTIHTGRNFLLGTATASTVTTPSAGATGIVGIQSGGTINTNLNFTLGDTNGDSTYTLSGGAINAGDTVVVGRQTESNKAGVMNQTGGTVTAAKGITIGDAQQGTVNTLVWGKGTYNVSGGVINANQVSGGTALKVAPQGLEGTFRVIGDGADINVNGNMTVNSATTPVTTVGTLAYRLETGESLSVIDVTGTATFANGAILNFDTSLASPTQTSYDLLIAGSIVDNGISFSGPSGWGYRIVDAPLPGDHNGDRVVDVADYVTWRSNDGANDQGYVDFRENLDNLGRKILQAYQLPSGSSPLGALGSSAVPEPASFVLVLIGVISLMVVRRR